MRASVLIAVAGAAALAAGVAMAQTATAPADSSGAVNAPPAAADSSSGGNVDLSPAGGFASSDTLGDTSKLKAGDPNVVSNAPVPDTHENRAKYGRPLSHAGRRTAATGD
jgi:hypothetical protein